MHVRNATQEDTDAISHLLSIAPLSFLYSHDRGFSKLISAGNVAIAQYPAVTTQKETQSPFRLSRKRSRLESAVGITAEGPPTCWISLAAALKPDEPFLDAALQQLIDPLRELGYKSLGWVEVTPADPLILGRLEFEIEDRIQPYQLRLSIQDYDHNKPSKLEIKRAGDSAGDEIRSVDTRAFAPIWQLGKQAIDDRLQSRPDSFIGYLDGEPIAYSISVNSFHTTHLSRIAVIPELQGHGYGLQLLNRVSKAAFDHGSSMITLNTELSNERSRRFYEKFGFVEDGTPSTVWIRKL